MRALISGTGCLSPHQAPPVARERGATRMVRALSPDAHVHRRNTVTKCHGGSDVRTVQNISQISSSIKIVTAGIRGRLSGYHYNVCLFYRTVFHRERFLHVRGYRKLSRVRPGSPRCLFTVGISCRGQVHKYMYCSVLVARRNLFSNGSSCRARARDAGARGSVRTYTRLGE